MTYTILPHTETEIYYDVGGKLHMIKNINTQPSDIPVIIEDYHGSHGIVVTSENIPANCPAEIAHKYLS